MFTGLITEVGTVAGIEAAPAGARIEIAAELAGELGPGDSVAVAGACLTVAECRDGRFAADVMNQTLRLTTLGGLGRGDRVNLEPALRAGDRLGGHLVQGHVDGTAEVSAVEPDGFARRVRFALPAGLERYVVEHGSIALDGASLTVTEVGDAGAAVSLIPETLERTTLGETEVGRSLNVEVDLIARYAERLMQGFEERSRRQDG